MLATGGVAAALSQLDANPALPGGADPNVLALLVSSVIILVGGALMLRSLTRTSSIVEATGESS